jgi:hypothetical protein
MVTSSEQPHEAVTRQDITWEVLHDAQKDLAFVRAELGEDAYKETKHALQDLLCNYFNSGSQCSKKGLSISPMGATELGGGKKLKVRWALPGGGKSGGLRLAVVAFCQRRLVRIAGAWARKEDPGDADFEEAFERAG